MKRVLKIVEVEDTIVSFKVEANKRRWITFKIHHIFSMKKDLNTCNSLYCKYYRAGQILQSPYKKYDKFCDFCNNFVKEYPEVGMWLLDHNLSIINLTPISCRRLRRFGGK